MQGISDLRCLRYLVSSFAVFGPAQLLEETANSMFRHGYVYNMSAILYATILHGKSPEEMHNKTK